MTNSSNNQHESVMQAVAGVLPMVEKYRDDGERDRKVAAPVVEALRSAGLLALWVPREYGGSEVSFRTFIHAVEEISKVDAAAGWVLANMAAGNVLTANLPAEGAQEVFARGPHVASPGSIQPKGRAVSVDGGYRLSGRWPLSSGCQHADWLGAVAVPFDGEAPRMTPFGPPDLQVMFIPRGDFEVIDTWNAMGLRGTGSADFAVNDVFVPQHRAFSFFMPQQQVAGKLYNADVLHHFGMALAVVPLGIARAAINEFVALAKEKTPTLSQTGLATRPTIHAEVAQVETLVQSARAYVYAVADEIDASLEAGNGIPEELDARRRLACMNAGARCAEAVDRVFMLAGSTPVYSGHRLERCLRDIQTARQHLFFSPVWWEKTGQHYFGQGLGMP